MRIKTSITLSEEVLRGVDRLAGPSKNRSAVLERAAREYIRAHVRERREARDRALYEEHADELADEALDALSFQVKL